MRAILTYHSIDPSGSPISCDPEVFDHQVEWLASGCVKVTTIEELVSLPPSADAVAITFDDGFVNFRDMAAPKLGACGLPATVFVATSHVGGANDWGGAPEAGIPLLPLLDWRALVDLQTQGVSIGAHSRTHPDLGRLSGAELEDEIRGSAEIIEREAGIRPTAFAYPYGRVTPAVAERVQDVFAYGCTTEFRTLGTSVSRALLPRLDMYYFARPERLRAWGTPGFEWFIRRRHGLRRLRRLGEIVGGGVLR